METFFPLSTGALGIFHVAIEFPATFKIPIQPEFPDVTFLKVSPGPLPQRYDVTIHPYDVLRWARLHDDASPWYRGPSPWGGPGMARVWPRTG